MLGKKTKIKKSLSTLTSLLIVSITVWGCAHPVLPVPNTAHASYQLFYFWDLRERESFFQIYNTSATDVARVHIQIFNAADNCSEFDFFDSYTPRDTHVYNVRNLTAINSGAFTPPNLDNGYGLVVATLSDSSGDQVDSPVLIGKFRIIDNAGYEYRSHAAGIAPNSDPGISSYIFNFGDYSPTQLSDVVGMVVSNVGPGPRTATVSAGGNIAAIFQSQIYDENELVTSCPPVVFACDFENEALQDQVSGLVGSIYTLGFDIGINNAITNSRGAASICPNLTEQGFVQLTLGSAIPDAGPDLFFVGFAGMNNGKGLGSMNIFTTQF
jgi:hypothetical protein